MVTVDSNTVGTAADYATLALWDSGERTDLLVADKIARAAMKDELHTGEVAIGTTWASDATRYIWIDAENAAARHDGTAGTGARVVSASTIPIIFQNTAHHAHVTWLELSDSVPSDFRPCLRINSTADNMFLHMDKLIMRDQGIGFFLTSADNCTVDLINTAIYNCDRHGISLDGIGHTVRIYNNTVWNVGRDGAGHAALDIDSPSTTDVDMRNTLLHADALAAAITITAGSGDPWNAGCDQNILSDGSGTTEGLPGDLIESATFQAGTGGAGTRVMFANLTAGTEDLRLVEPVTRTDNAAIEFGNNLTAEVFPENISISEDIAGDTRAAAGAWDAGADGTPLPAVVSGRGGQRRGWRNPHRRMKTNLMMRMRAKDLETDRMMRRFRRRQGI